MKTERGLFHLQALHSWSKSAAPNALMQEADGSLCVFFSSLFMVSSIPATEVTSIPPM